MMFTDCNVLTNLDLSSFNTANVTTMGYMFSNCNKLEELDIRNFDIGNVTDDDYFYNLGSGLDGDQKTQIIVKEALRDALDNKSVTTGDKAAYYVIDSES